MIQNTKWGRHIAWTGPCHKRGTLVGDHSRHIGGSRRGAALDLSGDSVSRGIRKRIATGDKMVDDICVERLPRFQEAAIQNELHGSLGPHAFQGADRPAITGKKPETDLGETELAGRVVDRNDAVESQCEFEAAADTDPVNQDH